MLKRIQAPLKLSGVDGRYASALYCAASRKEALEKVNSELKDLKNLLVDDSKVLRFLETPTIDRKAKQKGIEVILGQKSEITKNFFNLLAENGRLGETMKIMNSFESLMVAHRGEVNVVITSTTPLDAKNLGRVKDVLSKNELGGKGKKLVVTNKVDPKIIGGLIVEIGDNTIDLSVLSKITKLNSLLTQAV